jgi:GNAT superfamily N-acetyltransferase
MDRAVVVRPLAREDHADWEQLWAGYNAFYGRRAETALPEAITQATWSRFFDAQEPMHALVALLDGDIVGITHYLFHRSTTSLAPTCYLQDLFTKDGLRGQGVGRALIEAVGQRATQAGSDRVYWHTQETNATARALYDKITDASGFIVYRWQL